MDVLLPVFAGLAVVPFILGIRAWSARVARRGGVRSDPRARGARGDAAPTGLLRAYRGPITALAVLLVAMVGFFVWIDAGVANKTLFEAQVPGTTDAAPVELTFTVPVEHPGARHAFDVNPRDDGGDVSGPIEVAVRITDPTGTVLVDEHKALDVRDDSTRSGISHYVWDSWDGELVPAQAGDYTLTVDVLSPHVPEVHVYVSDDQKTDGHRLHGYE